MDRFKVSVAATSSIFFWLPVALALMITGLFGTINYSFGLVFVILGIPSLAGYVFVLADLRKNIRSWYLGLPLAVTLITGTACAFYAIVLPGPAFPAEGMGLLIMNTGIAALLSLAPCALLLFIVLLQKNPESTFIKGAIGVSAVVSLLSIAMLLDMLFIAFHLYPQAVFSHPYGEGFLILYGLAGIPAQGILLLLAGRRFNGKSQTRS